MFDWNNIGYNSSENDLMGIVTHVLLLLPSNVDAQIYQTMHHLLILNRLEKNKKRGKKENE